ncbi:glycosyltransferase [Flavobacterium sp. JP2137]|uniref:glycosyltransferase n=1 Tax=Flavobacterium sp. JP2137 TaxID=3414510 RepID=UPI003D3014AD
MKLQNKYKIALVGFRLSGGGSDRVMANLSVYFDQVGVDVSIVTVIDQLGYPYSGEVFSTASLKNNQNGLVGKLNRMVGLHRFFRKNKFDYIIDFRFRTKKMQEWVISKFIYNAPTIFTIHSSKTDEYIPNSKWLAHKMYANAYQIIAITNAINAKIKAEQGLKKVQTIYNPVDLESIDRLMMEPIDLEFEYIIAVGQFENGIKQFDHLIAAYANSSLKSEQIHLVICGEGQLLPQLAEQADRLNITEYIHFMGFQSNPYKYMRKAKFFVLCSRFEGLPMVLIESLACHTPVVSYDCETGPREIVIPDENGLLVANQSIPELQRALDRLHSDSALYEHCKLNARQSIAAFNLEVVGKQWVALMKLQ